MTIVVFNMKYANERGKRLGIGADNVFQKIMLDTGSYTKSVRAMRETYRISVSLKVT